jgi:hypothetical protein
MIVGLTGANSHSFGCPMRHAPVDSGTAIRPASTGIDVNTY